MNPADLEATRIGTKVEVKVVGAAELPRSVLLTDASWPLAGGGE